MYAWSVIVTATKLCVCLLLLSMLTLLHYTLRHQSQLIHLPVQGLEAEQYDRGELYDRGEGRWLYDRRQQWSHEERRPIRALASSDHRKHETERATVSHDIRVSGAPQGEEIRASRGEDTPAPQRERTANYHTATQSQETAVSPTEQTISHQTAKSVISDTAIVPTVRQRPRPLPKFNIESLLQPDNDTVFQPHPGSEDTSLESPITSLSQHRHSQKIHLASDEMLSPRSPGGGYVVALRVYEQQTMASGNLLQLQCWASVMNMSLVTPFMKLSFILTPLDEARQRAHLSLWDTFSKTHWEAHTQAHGYLPLVEWREWVQRAPRKLIIVQFKYPLLSRVKEKHQRGVQFPHPHTGDAYSRGCEFRFVSGKALSFFKDKGFVIVRRACFNFQNGDGFTMAEFQEHLFGPYQTSQVTVLFDMWRGLHEPQRVLITDKICREKHPFREQVQPSPRLVRDAQTYRDKYLGPEDYIAVITRFEMTGLSRQHEQLNDTHAEIPRCIAKTLFQLNQLRADTGIDNTFISIDIGKYGSSSFAKKRYYHHLPEMMEFVKRVNGGRMALADIERTLESVSRTTDSGYIASLQQLIVTRARCILFLGGGSFQRHALHMYQELHPRIEDQCIYVVQSCTNPNRPIR